MVEALLAGTYTDVELVHLDASYSDQLGELGRVSMRKVVRMLAVVLHAAWMRLARRTTVLYYHPAGANRSAVVRDAFVLTVVRPMFRSVVFHHHAMGAVAAIDQLPRPLRDVARRALRGADVAIAPSASLLDEVRALAPQRAVVVPNGTAGGEPRPDRPGDPVPRVLFLNLVSEEKGAWWLLDAVAALHDRGVPVPVTFAGAFPSDADRQAFVARTVALGLDQHVSLPGLVTGPTKWAEFAAADVFCVPTTYDQESFGLAAVEAASCALPIVTTDVPGVRDVFTHEVDALLADPADPTSLVDLLHRACTDPDLRRSLGRRARTLFEDRYTVERYWQALDPVLSEVAGRHDRRSRRPRPMTAG